MNRNRMPSKVSASSSVSRVVPGVSETMARSSRRRALSKVDLPRFGAPRMATGTPSAMARPVEKPLSNWAMRSSKPVTCFPVTIAVYKLHVFLAKVKLQFHQGRVFDQGLAKGIDLIAKAATELLDGQLMGTGVFGIDEVANGLGLGEVSFAVQKGALGEFSGQRRATTGIDQALHEPLSNERAAVNVAFHNVFPSKALRAAEREQQGFIEGLLTVVQNSQRCAAGLTSFEFATAQGVDHRPSFGVH